MRIRLLGNIDVVLDGAVLPVPGLRRRALLAALALQRGAVVDKDLLVGIVWNKDAPSTALNTLQSHVSYLRDLLGDRGVIQYRRPGYILDVEGTDTDVELAENLFDQAVRTTQLTDRARDLRAVVDLWRGPALADVAGLPWLEEQADRLEHLHGRAGHALLETRFALGEHAQLMPELEQHLRDNPFDEQMHGNLILGLYRAGRQADALTAYQRLRTTLAEELGIEPSPDLRELVTAILRQDPALLRPPESLELSGPPIPAQLPAPGATFTGRQVDLDRLDTLLATERGSLAIGTIAGTAGVGKTTLALQWAYRVRDQFPDGQLFADLRGYDAGPAVRPVDALTGFLAALGVAGDQIPVDVDQAAALYRTMMAGRRMLILLDNARTADQIRPLLPGEPGSLVLITSRDRLSGLVACEGALPLPLNALTEAEAHQLLTNVLGEARVITESDATAELARACAFLPLALRIAAANLAWQPHRRIDDYLAELRIDRLRMLTIDDDPEQGVAAAFDASYQALTVPARRLFRLLSLVPGLDLTIPAAAALSGIEVADAQVLVGRLASAHLLDQPASGHYAWHDLLRAYAADRSDAEDSEADRVAASRRLYDWYVEAVVGAADLLYPHMLRLSRTASAHIFADRAAALDWLDTERANLVAAVRQATVPEAACVLADALRGYFHLRRRSTDWLVVGESALNAATALDDVRAQAAARHSVGTAYRCLGDSPSALQHYDEGLRLTRLSGWQEAEATALGNLGIVYQAQGRLKAAVGRLTLAIALDRRIGRTAGLANNLGNLAAVYLDQGSLEAAVDCFDEALELNRRSGSRHGQALALTGLAQAYREAGRVDDAIDRFTEAMQYCVEIGDRDGQAIVHIGLGEVARDQGRTADAREHAHAALTLARDGGDPRTEALALNLLASAVSDPHEALRHNTRAHELAERTTVPRSQIQAMLGLATATLRLGDLAQAGAHAERATTLATHCGYRLLEAEARATSARIHLRLGEPQQATG
ncbi:tetratricopeptide repeat protein [Kribbella qitaiheensis]|uniref:Tetratricopeptide repeat protein n=1 Tax=Kribbella qitaiheensis TaxID=1544730 RepID=A0A7G6WSH3_9ACTN|nr:BTAD domain-containing putative transcriptional regulator [Kribbella qitaiheensis]QNE16938.1 tetratricopeptide repeat protein [Kribbella qitaiheensis]